MQDRVNWRTEYEIHAWVLAHEKRLLEKAPEYHSPILDLQSTRDEIVRNLLIEIEAHDGPFGASTAPESIL